MAQFKFTIKAGTEKAEFLNWLSEQANGYERIAKTPGLSAGRRAYASGQAAAFLAAHTFWSEVEVEEDTPFVGRGINKLMGK